jgi:pantoate--beta-alanine ligase
LDADASLAEQAGADIIFAPPVEAMYAPDASVLVTENLLSRHLCGESRPGHFSGVCTVVAKLFHIVQPDLAVFGKKDRQQLAIIRRIVRDLDFPVEIVGVETVREEDGLAMSSRNRYLDSEQREAAPRLRHGMQLAREAFFEGERSVDELMAIVGDTLAPCHFARVDYIEIVDAETMQPVSSVDRPSVLAAAVFFGQTRLIDNIELDPGECMSADDDGA